MKKDVLTGVFSPASGQEALAQTAFEYGWCTTDKTSKDGKELRTRWRTVDFLKDEPYATVVKNMLEQLGLPLPKPEEIYRGTNHDLLFLNSHGVVVRIGPTNIEDLMNPAILQPLGWLQDNETFWGPFTVAVYPGIELLKQWRADSKGARSAGALRDVLLATGQYDLDAGTEFNIGIIRVLDEDKKEVAVELLLDADSEYNGSSEPRRAKKRAERIEALEEFFDNKADLLSQVMQDVYADMEDRQYWQRALEMHQPLRRLFWEAFKDVKKPGDMPDMAARKAFWESCARVTNNPQTATMPIWRPAVDADGVETFIRAEVRIPQVVLYRPWTGKAADQVIQPVSPEVREAIGKKHAALMREEAGAKPERFQRAF